MRLSDHVCLAQIQREAHAVKTCAIVVSRIRTVVVGALIHTTRCSCWASRIAQSSAGCEREVVSTHRQNVIGWAAYRASAARRSVDGLTPTAIAVSWSGHGHHKFKISIVHVQVQGACEDIVLVVIAQGHSPSIPTVPRTVDHHVVVVCIGVIGTAHVDGE